MEKHEQDNPKRIDWNGDERRHAPGAKPPIGDSDADEAEGR